MSLKYIPTSDDIKILKNSDIDCYKKYKESQINSALDMLKYALYKRYGKNYSIQKFIEDCDNNYKESDIFCKNIVEYINIKKWSKNTFKTIFYLLKSILKNTSICDGFINKLNISTDKNNDKYNINNILKKQYLDLPDNNDVKKRLKSWINIIRVNSKNKSPNSIKCIISFYTNICLPILKIDLYNWYIDKLNITLDIVKKICDNAKKYNWFKLFVIHILNKDFKYSLNDLNLSKNNIFETDSDEYYSGDKHVISIEELENIYYKIDELYKKEPKKYILDKLIYLILISTGMRIGGVVNIKFKHICDVNNNTLIIKKYGRTLEKGNKWFEFIISKYIRTLLYEWVIKYRKSNSDYLFPSLSDKGIKSHISTNTIRSRFKKICKSIGLDYPYIHIHSLRHTYAHILLNCGNDISIISKLLNHSDTNTTEKFYLKESISEVVNRANVPWLNKYNKKEDKVIPSFLTIENENNENKKLKTQNKIRRLELLQKKI